MLPDGVGKFVDAAGHVGGIFTAGEARVFAAELLMPLARVSERWFEESAQVGEAQLMQRECLLQA